MFFHALGNLNLHFLLRRSFAHFMNVASCPWQFLSLRRSITHSLNVLSCPRQRQLHVPLRRSFAHSLNVISCPWQFIPLRRSLVHSFTAASCPLQFQFIFPAPAVNHTFPECPFTSSIVSIYIPHSGGQAHIP